MQALALDHASHGRLGRHLLHKGPQCGVRFGRDASERYLPITERRRLSVVDVMRQAGLQPRLLSNQGQGGSWDQASSVIFRHSRNTFRARTHAAGQSADRPWDDEFFEDQLATRAQATDRPQVVFLCVS